MPKYLSVPGAYKNEKPEVINEKDKKNSSKRKYK